MTFKEGDVVLITESFGMGTRYIGELATVTRMDSLRYQNKRYELMVRIIKSGTGPLYVNAVPATKLNEALL